MEISRLNLMHLYGKFLYVWNKKKKKINENVSSDKSVFFFISAFFSFISIWIFSPSENTSAASHAFLCVYLCLWYKPWPCQLLLRKIGKRARTTKGSFGNSTKSWMKMRGDAQRKNISHWNFAERIEKSTQTNSTQKFSPLSRSPRILSFSTARSLSVLCIYSSADRVNFTTSIDSKTDFSRQSIANRLLCCECVDAHRVQAKPDDFGEWPNIVKEKEKKIYANRIKINAKENKVWKKINCFSFVFLDCISMWSEKEKYFEWVFDSVQEK